MQHGPLRLQLLQHRGSGTSSGWSKRQADHGPRQSMISKPSDPLHPSWQMNVQVEHQRDVEANTKPRTSPTRQTAFSRPCATCATPADPGPQTPPLRPRCGRFRRFGHAQHTLAQKRCQEPKRSGAWVRAERRQTSGRPWWRRPEVVACNVPNMLPRACCAPPWRRGDGMQSLHTYSCPGVA
jgi:hypothetical protein